MHQGLKSLRRWSQGFTPLTPLLNRVDVKQHCQNFAKHKIFTKLFWILQNWRKISRNWRKISRTHKIKNFAATLLLYNLPSATHPPIPSAKRFFISARQCYLEMKKTLKEPYFSILSSIILCMKLNVRNPVGYRMCTTWKVKENLEYVRRKNRLLHK